VVAVKSTNELSDHLDRKRYLPISRHVRNVAPNTIENSIINDGAMKRILEWVVEQKPNKWIVRLFIAPDHPGLQLRLSKSATTRIGLSASSAMVHFAADMFMIKIVKEVIWSKSTESSGKAD
jgi:hypothetical protein